VSGPIHDCQSVFPATQYTWIEDRLAEGDTGLAIVLDNTVGGADRQVRVYRNDLFAGDESINLFNLLETDPGSSPLFVRSGDVNFDPAPGAANLTDIVAVGQASSAGRLNDDDADASALIGIAPCPTDKNGDSRTDLQDLLTVLARFSANTCCAPVDDVAPSLSEIIDVLSVFGTECP
jgi:hypothetical protein